MSGKMSHSKAFSCNLEYLKLHWVKKDKCIIGTSSALAGVNGLIGLSHLKILSFKGKCICVSIYFTDFWLIKQLLNKLWRRPWKCDHSLAPYSTVFTSSKLTNSAVVKRYRVGLETNLPLFFTGGWVCVHACTYVCVSLFLKPNMSLTIYSWVRLCKHPEHSSLGMHATNGYVLLKFSDLSPRN